jgi:F420-non-reducing hydrogenase iron-sulfur subunit
MDKGAATSAFAPHVVVLYCGQCVAGGDGVAPAMERVRGCSARAAMMACSSQVEVSHVLKILESGADAVEVVACAPESCRSLVGSTRAERRIQYARTLLERVQLGAERVGITRKMRATAADLADAAAARAEAVRGLGPSPMRKGVGQ